MSSWRLVFKSQVGKGAQTFCHTLLDLGFVLQGEASWTSDFNSLNLGFLMH